MSWLGLGAGPSPPDEFYLKVAKTVIDGSFAAASFGKKPYKSLFPLKKDCPHCKGKGWAWTLGRAQSLLADMSKLAREIRRRSYCRSCLGELSNIAQMEKSQLKELGKGDPRSLFPQQLRWLKNWSLLLLGAISIIVILSAAVPMLFALLGWLLTNLLSIF